MKLVIKNALIYDGSGNAPFKGTVACADGLIKLCSPDDLTVPSDYVYDAEGSALAPGFIDAHSHSDMSILAAPEATGKVSQGVTAEVIGNCGLSLYPVSDLNREHLQELHRHYDVKINWTDLNGYLAELEKRSPAVDIIPLAGHNTLRASLCGYGKHELTSSETAVLRNSLAQCFEQGAIGFSTGLLYVPGKFASPKELTEFLKTVAEYGGIYTTHLRSEGNKISEALIETFDSSLRAGLRRVHISHLKVSGAANWHKIDEVFSLLKEAEKHGLEISADRYPYTESMTHLSVILPEPYADMDDIKLEELLRNDADFTKLKNVLETFSAERWRNVRLVSAPGYEEFCGLTFDAIAEKSGLEAPELCARILRSGAGCALAAFRGMNEENMLRIMQQEFTVCGSDESTRPRDYSIGRSHPRGFGSMPRFCNLLCRNGMPLEKAIRRMTSLPAQIFRLHNRGLIKEGFSADLVLFDPEKFRDTATFAEPHRLAEGIRKVWRRGKVIFENGG